MRIDNLRDYKREMGITAKLRRRPQLRVKHTPEQLKPCAKCAAPRYEHERPASYRGLVPDHKFVESGEEQ